jgi:DNA-binding NarL/FixJ family response regulator
MRKVNSPGRKLFQELLRPSEARAALLMCEHGLADKQIAFRMGIKAISVRKYMEAVHSKLGLRSQRELMLLYWTI